MWSATSWFVHVTDWPGATRSTEGWKQKPSRFTAVPVLSVIAVLWHPPPAHAEPSGQIAARATRPTTTIAFLIVPTSSGGGVGRRPPPVAHCMDDAISSTRSRGSADSIRYVIPFDSQSRTSPASRTVSVRVRPSAST